MPQLFGAMPPLSGAKPPHFGAMPPHSVPPPCLCVVAQCLSWALLRRCHATLCEARRTPVPSQSMPSHPAAPVHAISLLCRCIRNTALPQPFLATPCPRLANQGLAKAQPRLASANRRSADATHRLAAAMQVVALPCHRCASHACATPMRFFATPWPCAALLRPRDALPRLAHASLCNAYARPSAALPSPTSDALPLQHAARHSPSTPQLYSTSPCHSRTLPSRCPIRSCALPTLFLALAGVQQPRGRVVRPPVAVVAAR